MALRKTMLVIVVTILFPVLCLWILGERASWAQDDTYTLAHGDVFAEFRRAPVAFPHGVHEEALDAEGCGVCHHAPDEETGQLIYVEDEELSCTECHGAKQEGTAPALREAYHGSCTPCHRTLRRDGNKQSGPTTCGECHKTSSAE